MQLRDLAASKRDLLYIDPRKIQIEPGYNVRDLSTADALAKLLVMARSMKEIGFSSEHPITVRLKGEEVFLVVGHRRLASCMMAINDLGAEIEAIPCLPEARGTSEEDRCADLVISNSGEPLTALEIGVVVKRLIGYGWDNAKIATRFGWASTQTVDGYLTLQSAPRAVQDMVRNDEVSPSTAISTIRKHGEQAEETLGSALREAVAKGKTRVTAANVKSVTGEFQPTAGNFRVLIAALEKIAAGDNEDDADVATTALETVGVLKRQKAAA
jgi:ParB-like chromosome segregation protein Spo0J